MNDTPNFSIAIIADDLTGALDSAVAFSSLGARILLPAKDTRDVRGNACESYALASATNSRALTADAARLAATALTRSMTSANTLFVKIDSTLRGNPHAHLQGALDAWREKVPHAFAVICPALPLMGRTVHHGEVLDNLVPITRSAAAADPISSAASAELSTVFPDSVQLKFAGVDGGEGITRTLFEHVHDTTHAIPRTVWVDANTDEDLDRIAEAIIALGAAAVAVGSAGLAAAIARHRISSLSEGAPATSLPDTSGVSGHRPSTLVLVTSLHPAAREQVSMVGSLNSDITFLTSDVPEAAISLPPSPRVVVVTTAERESTSVKVDQFVAIDVALEAAVLAARILAAGDFDSILAIGGDGASALLRTLSAVGIEVTGELMAGVPIGHLIGGTTHGTKVVTRSGGFGNDQHLNEILSMLHEKKDPA